MPTPRTASIAESLTHLEHGGCVAIPTETVYGLAARIDQPEGIAAIFRWKARPMFDPLIVHVATMEDARAVTREWPALAEALAKEFWPGPLTMVLPKHAKVLDAITSGLDTVGVRMPNHPVALELLRKAGAPLAAPSANRFGRTSPTTAQHVRDEFPEATANKKILVLDGGASDVGVESTVVSIQKNEITLLRPGGVTKDALATFLKSKPEFNSVRIVTGTESEKKQSPGHVLHHYQPNKPLVVSWRKPLRDLDRSEFLGLGAGEHADQPQPTIGELDLGLDPTQAARRLYSGLRDLDQNEAIQLIFIYRAPSAHAGLWTAIDDRLRRAAHRQLGQAPNPAQD